MADAVFHIKVISSIDMNPVAVAGSVAPDIFYYYNFTHPEEEKGNLIGDRIHGGRHVELLSSFVENIKLFKDSTLFNFFKGLLSHLIVDSFIHHYIIARAGKYPRGRNEHWHHKILEMQIDHELLKHTGGSFKKYHDLIKEPPGYVIKFFAESLETIYGLKFSLYNTIRESFRDMKYLLTFFRDPLRVKRFVFSPLSSLFNMPLFYMFYPPSSMYQDPMNIKREKFVNPLDGDWTSLSVFEIFDLSVKITGLYIEKFKRYIYGNDRFPSRISKILKVEEGINLKRLNLQED